MVSEPELGADRELRRDLGGPQVLAIVVGAVVGSGIYIRPASIAQQVESPAWLMAVWIVGGILSLCGALTYAQLAMRIPGTGGEYLFLRTTLGRLAAFLFGWMRMSLGPAVVGALAVAFTVFLGDVVPLGGPWFDVAQPWSDGRYVFSVGPRQAIATSTILGLAWINTRGVGRAGAFQLVVTVCKVAGVVLLLTTIALLGRAASAPAQSVASGPSALGFGAAMLGVMATYNGWANVAIVGGEVRHAGRMVPWALVTGLAIVTGLYLVTNLAYLHTLSLPEIASANSTAHPNAPSVASLAVQRALGSRVATVLPMLFALSALGTAHCNLLVFPRIILSMARDRLLPVSLAAVSQRAATPNRAIWTAAFLAVAFALSGSYDRLTNLTAFGYNVFFALTTVGFLRVQRDTPTDRRGVAFWSATIIASLFLVGTVALLAASVARGSAEVLTGVGLTALGIPVFGVLEWLRARRNSRPEH